MHTMNAIIDGVRYGIAVGSIGGLVAGSIVGHNYSRIKQFVVASWNPNRVVKK
jgi:hypothetical protein